MKMMAAASCNERPPETQCAKEVANKLSQLQAERERQDKLWNPPTTSEPVKTDLLSKSKYEGRVAWTSDSVF